MTLAFAKFDPPPAQTLVPAGVTARFQAISARRCAIFTLEL